MMNDGSIEDVAIEPAEALIGLSERESYIQHAGQTILVHDYSGLVGDEAARLAIFHSESVQKRGIYNILLLVDVTDAYANKEALRAFKKATKRTRTQFKKVAIIGVVGVVKFFLDLVNRFSDLDAHSFNTQEEALDWLVE